MNSEFVITRKILNLGSRIVNLRSTRLQCFGLTSGQSETLQYFHAHPGHTASDLKDHLNISHQASRNMVDRLRSKQMLTLLPSKEDARRKEIHLTAEGQSAYLALTQDGTNVGHSLLAGFSEEEQRQFSSYLDRIISNLS